ncbi:Bromodomain-containing protein [Rhizopogon salebrosus TDB-379]|nr:Bromodomain-containing protein [Rhizopogon salebrosus TDB-379]
MGTNISTISSLQHHFCLSTVRSLKKPKDAGTFLRPIDPMSLNIPHYPSIIKNPMDLGTIEGKLIYDNNPCYYSTEEFVSDVQLVFSNCITFSSPDHMIGRAGNHVESVFDKQIEQLPPPAEDFPYADVPKKMCKAKVPKHDGTAEQLKYCAKILSDLWRQQHWDVAHLFYEPIVKLDIPAYYKVIKKPMDMLTMQKKLDAGEYPNATKSFEDFKLMIWNCFIFNPSGTPVNQAGIDLQQLFDEKWKHLPPLQDASDDEDDSLHQSTTRG